MKQILPLFLTFLYVISSNAQTVEEHIDSYIATVSKRYEIPGAAVAVIKEGKVTHIKYYGKANLEDNTPITEKSLFKLHSLSKVFVATAIFQLVEKGELSLEDDISKYIAGLPLTWQKVKIKHLLTHSSGLPDMVRFEALNEEEHRAKVFKADIDFESGERFSYNQTNFWLLNRIITKIGNTSLQNNLITNQFKGNSNALVFSRDTVDANRVTEYFANEEGVLEIKNFDVPQYMYGAAGIALTLNDFIAWNQSFDNNEFLKRETIEKMWSPFPYRNDYDFAYSWARERINNRKVIGFSGGTIVSLRKYLEDDLSVIVLTTGYKHFPDVNFIANFIAGLVETNLEDRNAVAAETLFDGFLNTSIDKAFSLYDKLKTENDSLNLESTMNRIGYALAGRNKLEAAISVFLVNTEEYPRSWNVWDSLGEGYEMSGDVENAILNYRKSVELNPENVHGIEKLKILKTK